MEEKQLQFQELLLKVQESLSQTEVLELVFLCTELLSKDLTEVVTARDLFSLLQKEDLLSSDDTSLLVELLTVIKHFSLIQKLSLSQEFRISRISPYRKLLFELAENITEDDLKNIKFLLQNAVPGNTLGRDKTLLQLFLYLEKACLLDVHNLDIIERIIVYIHPRLQTTISQFKATTGAGNPAQETKGKIEIGSQDLLPKPIPQDRNTAYVKRTRGAGDNVEGQMSSLNLTESSSQRSSQVQFSQGALTSTAEENPQRGSCPEEYKTMKLQEYAMSGDWRGHCLIINNQYFSESSKLPDRKGTDKDEKRLVDVFQWLGFKTKVAHDCSRAGMLEALENLHSCDHTQADCVVCCVLSHGCEGGVIGVDGEQVMLRELMEPLNGHCCPSLSEKPKLFFIQACQGQQVQQVAFLRTDGLDNSMETGIVCDAEVPRESIPSGADFLMALATVSNFVSYRDSANGSWFIQSLCENLEELVPRGIDLLSILTQVNNDVSKKTDRSGKKKQIPQPEFTLRKRVVFPNPATPPPSKRHLTGSNN